MHKGEEIKLEKKEKQGRRTLPQEASNPAYQSPMANPSLGTRTQEHRTLGFGGVRWIARTVPQCGKKVRLVQA